MDSIILKRHKIKFYFSVIFCSALISGTAISFISMFIWYSDKKLILLLLLSPFLLCWAYQIVAIFCKNTPIVSIDKDYIKFGAKEIYNITDIESIELTGKKPFDWFFKTPSEGTSIHFKNGTTKNIFDELYSNSSEFKLYLEQIVIEKKEYLELGNYNIDFEEYEDEYVDYFKGNQFLSFNGIVAWGIIAFYLYFFVLGYQFSNILFALLESAFCLFILMILNSQMNYFGISEHYFVVKNHNFIWKEKIYRLNNINEVVFETQGKMPNCLRIITKNFKSKLYPASTLCNETWLELKNALEKEGIKVRNECIR